MQTHSKFLENIKRNKSLIYQLTKRDINNHYKGSYAGAWWSFLTPILMLTVYTFVFSVVFKVRWNTDSEQSHVDFALILYVGMIVHYLFSDPVIKSTGLIHNNVNFVKKIVFPLELLPIITLLTTVFHTSVSILVLLAVLIISGHELQLVSLFLPVILLPIAILSLGLSWFLASLGVYFRDINQAVSLITTMMLFLAPVFYPLQAVPPSFSTLVELNPLTLIIEESRKVLIFGASPSWIEILKYYVLSIFIAILGFKWFNKTRKGFADVI